MEQEKVDEELVVAHGEAVLAADESEPGPELCQGLGHPQRHGLFHGLLVGFLPEAEEVQHERVLGDFSGQIGALPREAGLKVVRRSAGALVEAGPEVVLEDGSGPAVLDSLRHVPLPCGSVVELVDEDHDVAPRQLVSSLLTNSGLLPFGGEAAHVLQVRRREPPHVRELGSEVAGEPVQDLAAPRCGGLPFEDGAPDPPVELDHGRVHDPLCVVLGGTDLVFERSEGRAVSGGQVDFELCHGLHTSSGHRRPWLSHGSPVRAQLWWAYTTGPIGQQAADQFGRGHSCRSLWHTSGAGRRACLSEAARELLLEVGEGGVDGAVGLELDHGVTAVEARSAGGLPWTVQAP